jgi:hypothetical protein
MTNGDQFTVKHPELTLLLKTQVIVGDPENDRSLLHVGAIESAQMA